MTIPTLSRVKPARMMLAGRREPARLPARMAMANMLSESGASTRPVWSALYSSTIWRKVAQCHDRSAEGAAAGAADR